MNISLSTLYKLLQICTLKDMLFFLSSLLSLLCVLFFISFQSVGGVEAPWGSVIKESRHASGLAVISH